MNIIQWICEELMISEADVVSFIRSCPHRYKKYYIPKRNGDGQRKIAQPARQVKNLQRIVHSHFFRDLPIHQAATAYRKNTSIKGNVAPHKRNQYLLKMDFRDFFPSITPEDMISHIESFRDCSVSDSDRMVIARLFFYVPVRGFPLVLSIGAPTSPAISNTVLFPFDTVISDHCASNSIVYTRYADDITFSTNQKNALFAIPEIIRDLLSSVPYPNIKINTRKTIFSSKKFNRHVTGLVITNEGKVSIGRDKKRMIKSLVHLFATDKIETEKLSFLRGYLSFINDVEPEFISSLTKKYGQKIISKIKHE